MRRTVLIVDDHGAFRASAAALLEAGGFAVVGEAADGGGAIAQVERLRPQVVLLDIQLPDQDGFAVAERLSAVPDPPRVVLISSRDASAYGPRLLAAPALGFIAKRQLSGQGLAALVDERELERALGSAAKLAVENEALRAEVLAQLHDLRGSRTRIVEAGDAERRRLERNLHDGAQQRLLALSYDVRLARAEAAEEELAALLDAAGDETDAALDELRDLAHGIYPAILTEAGLAAALETLADEAPLPVEVGDVDAARHAPAVETTAYIAIADAIEDARGRGATFLAARVIREGDRLVITAEDDGVPRGSRLVHVADRVGALGGSLDVGEKSLRAEVPCA
jgi:DNA-binding NarL/FixJ family response regulator